MDNVPIVLAQYRLGKTLGIGAFGKVKCKHASIWHMPSYHCIIDDDIVYFFFLFSGTSYYYGFKSSSKDFEQRQDQTHGDGGEGTPRDQHPQDVHTSTHHSSVSTI